MRLHFSFALFSPCIVGFAIVVISITHTHRRTRACRAVCTQQCLCYPLTYLDMKVCLCSLVSGGVSGVLFLFFVDFLVFEVTFLCGLPHGCPIGNLFSLIIFISTIIITVARLASKRKHGGRKPREWVAGGGRRGRRGGVGLEGREL